MMLRYPGQLHHSYDCKIHFILACLVMVIGCLAYSPTFGQSEFVENKSSSPATATAARAARALDDPIELGSITLEVSALPRFLQEHLTDIAVYLDPLTLDVAKVDPTTRIEINLPKMSLRSSLRKLLEPLGLRVQLVDEGLAITPHYAVLSRRGIATQRWLGNAESISNIVKRLDQVIAIEVEEEPLHELIAALSKTSGIPMLIDQRSLAEIGISHKEPITSKLTHLSLRSSLSLMLGNLDLTYMIQNEVLQITTVEAAEQNQQGRIYFLEGTGVTTKQSNEVATLITTTIAPAAWEQMGGPSTAVPCLPDNKTRPAIIVSTTFDIHDQIDALLTALRQSNLN